MRSSSFRIFLVKEGGSIDSSIDCSDSVRLSAFIGLWSIFFSSPRVNYAILVYLNSVSLFLSVSSHTWATLTIYDVDL